MQIHEAGTVWAHVSDSPWVWKIGKLMYDDMWGILSASRPLHNVSLYEVSEGVCGYTFTLELNSTPTTLAWTMRDSLQEATDVVFMVRTRAVKHIYTNTQMF